MNLFIRRTGILWVVLAGVLSVGGCKSSAPAGAVTLVSVEVTPNPASILVGSTQQFAATGTYSDGTTKTLTTQVVWTSSDTTKATVGASTGLVTAVAPTAGTPISINAAFGSPATNGGTFLTVNSIASAIAPPGNMTIARFFHTATLLVNEPGSAPTNGKILVIGGQSTTQYLSTAELYDPATQAFTATGSMLTARAFHTATLLNNGLVLVTGGYNGAPNTSLNTAELYDPSKGTFSPTGNMITARYSHVATLLSNGKVLITGGFNGTLLNGAQYLNSAELYDPTSGTFTATGVQVNGRDLHTATPLNNGSILLAGGQNPGTPTTQNPNGVLNTTELYAIAGTFAASGTMATGRASHTATLLGNGTVLIAGGSGASGPLASAELYTPGAGTFTATGNMTLTRYYHTAALLSVGPNTGKVLLAGGCGNVSTASAELYDPGVGTFAATGASMTSARYGHTATVLTDGTGKVLITGGSTVCSGGASGALSTAELYDPVTGTFTLIGQ